MQIDRLVSACLLRWIDRRTHRVTPSDLGSAYTQPQLKQYLLLVVSDGEVLQTIKVHEQERGFYPIVIAWDSAIT